MTLHALGTKSVTVKTQILAAVAVIMGHRVTPFMVVLKRTVTLISTNLKTI